MNPDDITLENLNKNFEYAKISREIDSCEDLEKLKNVAKCYVKLFLKTQETIISLDSIKTK
jgi:hypothetical protein